MNKACPECGTLLVEAETVTPYERNDKAFTLQFCSPACRDAYKDEDEG